MAVGFLDQYWFQSVTVWDLSVVSPALNQENLGNINFGVYQSAAALTSFNPSFLPLHISLLDWMSGFEYFARLGSLFLSNPHTKES